MIKPEDFGKQRALATGVLQGLNGQLTRQLGKQVRLELVWEIDKPLLDRMIALEEEVFRIEDNVYSEADIRECLAEEDSLLLLLWINDRVEGYLFGYDDEPEAPVVAGTEYFIDSAVVSLAYQAKGIGTQAGFVVLFLIYLLGYRSIGITTEERDKTGRELAEFYRRLGFVDAPTDKPENVGLKIELDTQSIKKLANHLPPTDALSAWLQE
jgi:GNAT superfamily N-acetyltransferase